MVDDRPYSLLLRLGIILLPILAGVLAWSYYHPLGSVLTSKAVVVLPAPVTPRTAPASELAAEPADAAAVPETRAPVAIPARAPVAIPAPTAPAVSAQPAGPRIGPALGFAPDRPMPPPMPPQASTGAGTAASMPAGPSAKQPPASGREQSKAAEARKQDANSANRTIQKLDSEVDRKLGICRGC